MTKPFFAALALGTALALSACDSNDNADQAKSAAAGETAVDPNNPFAHLEAQMNDRMMAAAGTDPGDTWVRMMIEHHQGAVDMSRLMLEQNPSEHVAQMAQDTIDKQTKEILELRALVKDGPPNPQSAEPYRQAMTGMQQAMMAATRSSVEETFMAKMLAHHEGAVALSDVALHNGVTGALRSKVTKTRTDQQKEAEMLSDMVHGEGMAEGERSASAAPAPATAPAPVSPSAARSTAAAPSPSPTASSRPRETPAPVETADPHAGHTMSNQ